MFTRVDIGDIKVGTEISFGNSGPVDVTDINTKGNDINGKYFVCGSYLDGYKQIYFCMKEDDELDFQIYKIFKK